MIIAKLFKIIGIIFVSLGLLLLLQRNNPTRIAFKSSPIKQSVRKKEKSSNPVRLIIENQSIDLPIFSAKVYGQKWETTSLGVSWLDLSPIPGEKGNSIIYGHNWTNLLGRIIYVRPGDEIKVSYEDGTVKKFIVDNTAMVAPDNVSVLNQTSKRMITIYTCAGIFDEKRFVVIGTLLQEISQN